MQIWAHTLVQNEGRWLWFAVTSVIDHIDRMLLWDYGSSDDTPEIIKALKEKYGDKIMSSREAGLTAEEFPLARQKMLDATKGEWILMLDGDEIWWEESISKVVAEIRGNGETLESIVVPTKNAVGDIFHFQGEDAGKYRIGDRKGNINMRAINKSIPGLHSSGIHGQWGWADSEGKMIQERNLKKIRFIDAPYIHTSFLHRSSRISGDIEVTKRKKKIKYEFGMNVSKDYYFPESFFKPAPQVVPSPWTVMGSGFRAKAILQTPLRKLKRKIISGGVGY